MTGLWAMWIMKCKNLGEIKEYECVEISVSCTELPIGISMNKII